MDFPFVKPFERITERQQRDYLAKFWLQRPFDNAEKIKLDKCAKYVYQNAQKVFGADVQQFMGVRLLLRMLAEVCMRPVHSYVETNIESAFDIKNVLDLYQRFVSLKYEAYFGDDRSEAELVAQQLKVLGLRSLFPKFAKETFGDREDGWAAELCQVGLVQSSGGGPENVNFIHCTLAQYYCADLVVDWLREGGRQRKHAAVVELLLSEILLQDAHSVIRTFINHSVSARPLSEDAEKSIGSRMSQLWRDRQHRLFNHETNTGLHVAVWEGKTGIIDVLMGAFRSDPVRLVAFAAARDQDGETALGLAANVTNVSLMTRLLRHIETCPYEVILEVLLATYITYDYNSLNAEAGRNPRLKEAFVRTKQIVRRDIPSFLAAAERSADVDYLISICGLCFCQSGGLWARKVDEMYRGLENDAERRCVLLARNGRGQTALHLAAREKRGEDYNKVQTRMIKSLCDHGVPEVGRSFDGRGWTPLHRAAAAGRLDAVRHFLDRGVHIDCLSSQDGETALFCAARKKKFRVMFYLIENGSDFGVVNKFGETALDFVPKHQHAQFKRAAVAPRS